MSYEIQIRISELTVRLGARAVLRGIDCAIGAGEQVALIGPSGAGKSTLLRAVAGLIRPVSGAIRWGETVWFDAAARRWTPPEDRRIGMVAQAPALWAGVSVREHLRKVLHWRGVARGERTALVEAWLARVGLTGLGERQPHQLSGGEAQRLALARAMISRPNLLLLDEPFGALDVRLRSRLAMEVAAMAREQGVTTLHVTHDPVEALQLGDRVLVLEDGAVGQFDTPRAIANDPRTPFARTVAERLHTLQSLSGALLRTPEKASASEA